MGEVWRAHDTVTDRVVAIKVLPAKLSKDEDFQQRFRREAHAAARLETPHVVPIYDYGEIDGRLFVSMRLINGRDLATVLADGPLEPARAARIIGQVAEALHAAHGIGLIHRDIKPSNILLDDRDFAYLIDFGIARIADDTRMTKTGNTIGTFAYIAPERLDGRGDEDARVDIYSLACVLYECLAGDPPFGGDTMARLVAAHLNTPPPRPSIARPNVPPQVDEVIATGMAKDPDQRYATTVELADAAHDAITTPLRPSESTLLAAAPQSEWSQPAYLYPAATQHGWPPGPQPRPAGPSLQQPARWIDRNRWWPLGVVAVVVVVALLIVGIYVGTKSSNKPAATSIPTSTARTTPTTTTPTGPPPVAEAALAGLFLSPDQISTAMGTTGMTITDTFEKGGADTSADVSDKACLPMVSPAQTTVYPLWRAVRGQVLAPAPSSTTHFVMQFVVMLSSAHDADAFFTASAQQWPACANRQYTLAVTGKPDQVWTVGPVSNINGTLSATKTGAGGDSSWTWHRTTCQRALTVANNVVVDVRTCSENQSDAQSNSAVDIAHQIAARVPT